MEPISTFLPELFQAPKKVPMVSNASFEKDSFSPTGIRITKMGLKRDVAGCSSRQCSWSTDGLAADV